MTQLEIVLAIVAALGGLGGLAAWRNSRTAARKADVEALATTVDKLQEENERLRRRIEELETENGRLRQRIEELEKENRGLQYQRGLQGGMGSAA